MIKRPTITDRLRLALKVYRSGLPARQVKRNPIIYPDWRVGQAQWQIIDIDTYIAEGFNANSLIYSAIMYKAKALSSIPLRVYQGDTDNPESVPEDNYLAKVVARPNASMSWREFQMLQTVWLNLAGNAYTYVDKNSNGEIQALYPLNPMRVYIVPGTGGGIKGFLYVPEGHTYQDGLPFLPDMISHVKFPNPGDPLDGQGYGLSPLSAAAKSADVDNSITNFLKIFFERGTMVAGLLKFDVPLDDKTVAGIRLRWKEIYGGYENWDETGVLDQGGEYQRLGYTFDEMGFETLDERNESRVLGPLGVPPQLINARIGLKHSTYNNWAEAREAFWQDTLLHEAKLFEDDYQYYLNDGRYWVAFDFLDVPAFQKDLPMMVDAWAKLVNLGVPKNNASEATGLYLGELPDGEVSYMPLNLIPIGSTPQEAPASAEAAPESVDTDTDEKHLLPAQVKKNGRPPSAGRFIKSSSALIGVGKASSVMALKRRSNETSEKY